MNNTGLIIERLLFHVFSGDMAAALTLIDPEASFIATRPDRNPRNPLHGAFVGPGGVQAFFELFLSLVEPSEFVIEGRCHQGNTEVLHGRLRHLIRQTGAAFVSDWAAIAQLRDGKILRWHFYEDSEALGLALSATKYPALA